MALLTAEDVLNKAFSKTKYREGFDQDEVDDFLDEVANAISALTAERDELQTRLAQYQSGNAPEVAAAVATPAAPASAPAGMSSASADLLAAATDPNPPSATTMLSMAQKLHDDYLQAGESERDRIIGEGKAKAEAIVEQAETDARVRMQSLDSDRADLERRIDDLRRFERDYRGHLRNYLENLLGDLEHNSARGGADAPGAQLPQVTALPPLFGSALVAEPSLTPQEPVAELYVPVVPSEPFVPMAQPEPYVPVVPSEPFVPMASPEAPAQHFAEDEQAPQPSFEETLPPFPGTSQLASPFGSPFKDANPFAPVEHPDAPAQYVEPQAPASPVAETPEEDTPRWNF